MHRIFAVLVLPLLALTGCAVIPIGPATTEDRSIEAATAVVLKSSGDLVITRGDPALRITAPSSVLDRLTSTVEDGVLVLDSQRGFGIPQGPVQYELTLPAVESVTIDGSGDVTVDFSGAQNVVVRIEGSGDLEGNNIDADSVEVTIQGSGDIDLDGATGDLAATIKGSGDLELENLVAHDATATIDGSGSIRVHATRTLSAEVNGSGTIRYSGPATVTSTRISGSGEIVQD